MPTHCPGHSGHALAWRGRVGRGFQLRNPNLLIWRLQQWAQQWVLCHTQGIAGIWWWPSREQDRPFPFPEPLSVSGGRQDQPPLPDLLSLQLRLPRAWEWGAAAERLRMEELSTPWQRSPASPPQAHLADGGNTNYPRVSGSCVVRVMLFWSCATPLSTRQRFRGSGVNLFGVTRGDVVAPAWQEDAAANPVFSNQSKGWKQAWLFPSCCTLALGTLISLIPPRNSQKKK